jgi:hypothetical protein
MAGTLFVSRPQRSPRCCFKGRGVHKTATLGSVSSRLKVHQIIIEKYPTLKYTSTYHAEILDTWKGAGEIDQVDTETGYSANVLTGWQVPAGH